MQAPGNVSDAFFEVGVGESMVFLCFERKSVKNRVIVLAIFRQGA